MKISKATPDLKDWISENKSLMSEAHQDLDRMQRFAANQDILVPCDQENLPESADIFEDQVYWICFEFPELLRQSSAVNPELHQWGMMSGFDYLKFLNERIEQGGKHFLVINPGTESQAALDSETLQQFLNSPSS